MERYWLPSCGTKCRKEIALSKLGGGAARPNKIYGKRPQNPVSGLTTGQYFCRGGIQTCDNSRPDADPSVVEGYPCSQHWSRLGSDLGRPTYYLPAGGGGRRPPSRQAGRQAGQCQCHKHRVGSVTHSQQSQNQLNAHTNTDKRKRHTLLLAPPTGWPAVPTRLQASCSGREGAAPEAERAAWQTKARQGGWGASGAARRAIP